MLAVLLIFTGFLALATGLLRVVRCAMTPDANPRALRRALRPGSLFLAFALCFLSGLIGFYPFVAEAILIAPMVTALGLAETTPIAWTGTVIARLAATWTGLAGLTVVYLWFEPKVTAAVYSWAKTLRGPITRMRRARRWRVGGWRLPDAPIGAGLSAVAIVGLAALALGGVGGLIGLDWQDLWRADPRGGGSPSGRFEGPLTGRFDPWLVLVVGGILSAFLAGRLQSLGHGALYVGATGALGGVMLVLAGAATSGMALLLFSGLQAGVLILWTQGVAPGRQVPRPWLRRLRDGIVAALFGFFVFTLTMPHGMELKPERLSDRLAGGASDAVALLAQHLGSAASLFLASIALVLILWVSGAVVRRDVIQERQTQ